VNSGTVLLLVFGIGFVAGLRSMTAPAVVAWAACLGRIHLAGTHLSFMGSKVAVGILTLAALGEFVADKLPTTPARTSAMGLGARIVTGALSGACVGSAGGASIGIATIVGIVGALAGTFGGYYARTGLVRSLKVKDIVIAIPEDLIAIGLGVLVVTRFS
jgi:uncharacterized membrane protein